MNFIDYIKSKKEEYRSFKTIYSPALKVEVRFNSKGFNHITFRNHRNQRNIGDQISRLKIIHTAYELIKFTNTFQEYEKTTLNQEICIQYWGMIAIFKKVKLKVILKKIGGGDVFFWSVIPAYTTSEKRDGEFKIKGTEHIE